MREDRGALASAVNEDAHALATVGNALVSEARQQRELLTQFVELVRQQTEYCRQQLELARQQTELLQGSSAVRMPKRFYSVSMVATVLVVVLLALFVLYVVRSRGV